MIESATSRRYAELAVLLGTPVKARLVRPVLTPRIVPGPAGIRADMVAAIPPTATGVVRSWGAISADSWLPLLPTGASVGAMPASQQERHDVLYQTFAEAWRVTDETSLFVYEPGSSTKTVIDRDWPAPGRATGDAGTRTHYAECSLQQRI